MSSGMHSRLYAGGVAATLAALSLVAPAKAEQLNCGAYAAAAVAQQQQNVQQGCGFTGGAWSADFNAHFNWCQSGATMADLTREDRARSDALTACTGQQGAEKAAEKQKLADCQEYARRGVEHETANQYLQCGFGGGAWSKDYAAHFNWCLKADPAAAAKEDSTRYARLEGCISAQAQATKAMQEKLKADCNAYADYSTCMARRGAELDCGFTGGRWDPARQPHFDWCTGASAAARQAENAKRNSAIEDCRSPDLLGKLTGAGKKFMAACP